MGERFAIEAGTVGGFRFVDCARLCVRPGLLIFQSMDEGSPPLQECRRQLLVSEFWQE